MEINQEKTFDIYGTSFEYEKENIQSQKHTFIFINESDNTVSFRIIFF